MLAATKGPRNPSLQVLKRDTLSSAVSVPSRLCRCSSPTPAFWGQPSLKSSLCRTFETSLAVSKTNSRRQEMTFPWWVSLLLSKYKNMLKHTVSHCGTCFLCLIFLHVLFVTMSVANDVHPHIIWTANESTVAAPLILFFAVFFCLYSCYNYLLY